MCYYFRLQWLIIVRTIKSIGLHWVISGPALIIVFLGLSVLLNSREYGSFLYMLLAIFLLYQTTNQRRLQFLRKQFDKLRFIIVRLLENIAVVSPFLIFYLFNQDFLEFSILSLTTLMLVFFKKKSFGLFTLPHPFAKYDYEWISAFRKYFLLPFPFLFIYIMGVIVQNYMLSLICACLLMLILVLPFQEAMEKPVLIWQYNLSTASFLKFKIRRIMLYSIGFFILFIPIIAKNPDKWIFISFVYVWCFLTVVAGFLTKYSRYPSVTSQINQSIVIAVSLAVFIQPYLAFIALFIIYMQSINSLSSLKPILDDQD
ncbi:MAG: hypothetical protein GDA42_13120 [Ekhidna sp.]|nr:hypothetical protein [Ekhidna sp.]MBC6411367.1 hypothetical protein [Ekhidna sp.]